MFTEVFGLGLAARPATDAKTFGWCRLEILAAAFNAVLLFGVAIYVLIEAWRRLSELPEIRSGLMLAVAIAGLAANAFSLWLLRRAQAESLNMGGRFSRCSATCSAQVRS
jgi:cobalt-zinc-cadmium efflux system protein